MTSPGWTRVERLFHSALERAPAEREAFLAEACGGDEALRHEVLSLLAEERSADRLMGRPAAAEVTQRLAVARGTRLGPYEVADLVGAGGMGAVYRARDTRLDRDVAVKLLPEHVAQDGGALARFDREARAVAALNHPHIAALFDIGETGGTHYLVMELLEGETLDARLRRGALSEKQALRVGAEIAESLGAAHAHGVVHGDVKPGNVMLTANGVKLLDFGLARLQRRGFADRGTGAPTGPATGVIAGTLGYMAPELLEGRPADARTDIWAFGCVLFEMLTGTRAFEGDSAPRLVAAIERDEAPSPASRRPGTSAALDRLVRRCLRKDPAERWSSASDLALRLREMMEPGADGEARQPPPARRRWAAPALAGLVLAAALGGVAADRLWLRPPDRSRAMPVVRSEVDLTADWPLRSPSWHHNHPLRRELDLSPDGTLLVWTSFKADDPTHSALHLRRLDTGEVAPLPGTERASQPFFSPDGRWIGFVSWEGPREDWQPKVTPRKHRLLKVAVAGGLAVELAELPWLPKGIVWAENGMILMGSMSGGIHSIPAAGGKVREITSSDRTREAGHQLPSLLPGGQALLLTASIQAYSAMARVEVLSLRSGERKVLVEDAADARYLPTGHLVFVRRGVLMAAPFDRRRLELTAPPVPVVEGVSQALLGGTGHLGSASAQYAVSDSGVLVYAPGSIFGPTPVDLRLVDEKGGAEPLPGFDKPLVSPQLHYSPDRRQVAFVEQDRSGLIWLFDVERRTFRALSDRGVAASPRWSPDGTRLVVGWSEAGPIQLWVVPTGRGEWERLTNEKRDAWAPSWSPDGRFVAFVRGDPPEADVFLYQFEDRTSTPFLAGIADEMWPEFSPDGRWLAYGSNESGRFEVYVTSFPGRERTLTVSHHGGMAPAWSRDGRELFYYTPRAPDGGSWMMAVRVRRDPDLSLGQPRALFRLPDGFVSLRPMRGYELHPDGRRFIIGTSAAGLEWTSLEPPITRLTLVHNWFAGLERLAPTRR